MKTLNSLLKCKWLFAILFFHGISYAQTNNNIEHKGIEIKLRAGQLLSIVAPIAKAGGEDAVKSYYQQVFPLAKKFGLENKGTLITDKTVIGRFKPQAWVLFTWPDHKSEQAFEMHEKWPDIKALRPLAWDELKIVTAPILKDKTLRFLPNKFYTLAFAWFDQERPNDYLKYLSNIEPILKEVGGRYIHVMKSPDYEVHASNPAAPSQLTIVEWDSIDGLQKLQAHDGYQEHTDLLHGGTVDFELHIVHVESEAG